MRCRLLVHIVDVSGSEGRDPIEDFEKINEELVKFNPELAKQPQIVAGNKIDMAEPEQIERFKKYVEDKGYDYYSICAPIMEGTKELMNAVWNKLQTLPPIKEYEVEEIPFEALVKDDKGFKITQVDEHYFLVEASWFYGEYQPPAEGGWYSPSCPPEHLHRRCGRRSAYTDFQAWIPVQGTPV